MEQLIFELATPEPPAFANFVQGHNAEASATLRRFAEGEFGETGVVLWGAPGAGKSHLLRAAVGAAQAEIQGPLAAFPREPGREGRLVVRRDELQIADRETGPAEQVERPCECGERNPNIELVAVLRR